MVLIKLMVGYARVYRWIHKCVTLGCFLCWNFGPHLLDPKMDTKLPQKLGHPLWVPTVLGEKMGPFLVHGDWALQN